MKYVSVTEVIHRIKDNIQKDYRLQSVAMEGNIIGLKRASNGHYYMNLHDDNCSIRAILFRSRVGCSMETVREGDHVIVVGAVNVYEKGGTVSFIIERLFSQGVGSLQAEYERIKGELERDGYFDVEHKKDLPRFPWTVGVLTSRTGAVLHDIRKIAAERNPYVDIRLYAIPVQGSGAEIKIADAINRASQNDALDIIILARGGGSMEDLWCFNSPAVVKAIYESPIPFITAIGHETDTTLADFAADVRAATPTHAAEMAFPDFEELEMDLAVMADTAYTQLLAHIEQCRKNVDQAGARLQIHRYREFLALKQEHVAQLIHNAGRQLELVLSEKKGSLASLQASIEAMNPAALVRKGYGQLEQDQHIISSIHSISKERPLHIQLVDGAIAADVKEVVIYGENNR